jgi:hypothetical protein
MKMLLNQNVKLFLHYQPSFLVQFEQPLMNFSYITNLHFVFSSSNTSGVSLSGPGVGVFSVKIILDL